MDPLSSSSSSSSPSPPSFFSAVPSSSSSTIDDAANANDGYDYYDENLAATPYNYLGSTQYLIGTYRAGMLAAYCATVL